MLGLLGAPVGFGVGGGSFPPYQGVDITPGSTLTASSQFGPTYSVTFLIDGQWLNEEGDTWLANTAPAWARVDLGEAKHIYRYSLRWWNNSSVRGRAAHTWSLEGSDDGSSWTTLDTQTAVPQWSVSERREYVLAAPVAYRYYRLYIDRNQDGSGYVQVGELELLQ